MSANTVSIMIEEFQEDIDELMDDVEPVGDDAESQLYEHCREIGRA